jgi:hypothetical protein
MKHDIRIYEYQVLELFAVTTTSRFRAVCTCGECSPGYPTDRGAINAGFAHLDNVQVPR